MTPALRTNAADWLDADAKRARSLLAQLLATDLTTASITKARKALPHAGANDHNAKADVRETRKAIETAEATEPRDDALAMTEAIGKGEPFELTPSALPALGVELGERIRYAKAAGATLTNAWYELSLEIQRPNYLAKLVTSWGDTLGYVPPANAKHSVVAAKLGASEPHLNALARMALTIAATEGATKGELKRMRDGLKARTVPMVTLATVRADIRGEAQNTPAAKGQRAAQKRKALDQERDRASATAAAKARAGSTSAKG
jgi:hypothetical protein